jgi:hypothetical protein
MSKEDVIRFNVGGTLYEVALTTLMKSPETMLAKLASKKWCERSGNDADESIFIDRDGEIFKYILAWYRNNVILIPRTIHIGAVKNEVKYFSLPNTVVVEQEKIPISECFEELKGHKEKCEKDIEKIKTEFQKRQIDLFATWAVQNAIQKEHLNNRPTFSTHKEYLDAMPCMNVSAVLLKVKEKIKELGCESICTVNGVYSHNCKSQQVMDLKFDFL